MCKFKTINLFIILLLLLGSTGIFAQLLDSEDVPKFQNNLPVIKDLGLRVDLTNGGNIAVKMREMRQNLGLNFEGYTDTKVWGYEFPGLPPTYPGATIVAKRDVPVDIKWKNKLPGQFLPVDPSLHLAHGKIPDNITDVSDKINWIRDWYAAGNVPVVTHLHGGHTESASDGLPEAWYTQGWQEMGNYFVKKDYHYDNNQESATLWYHDHALGITRLNVYAGLAGFYLLRDNNELNLINNNTLPGGDYEIEIVIQDRMFDQSGELFWPAYPGDPAYADFINGEGAVLPEAVFPGGGPTALAEFFGNIILVNGKAWPKLDVEPRKYRFRFLNGSDSRFYILEFRDDESAGTAQPFLQIGSDDGLLEGPVQLNRFIIAPGERIDLVIDFSGLNEIYLRNFGPDEPFKGFNSNGTLSDGEDGSLDPADEESTGQIMKFDVTKAFNDAVPNATVSAATTLNSINSLGNATETRQLGLFEGSDEYGRLQPLLGALKNGNIESLVWDDEITEKPAVNTVEEWEVYNFTADAHPVHLHLVAFQIIDREKILGFTSVPKDQVEHNGAVGTGATIDLNSVVLSGESEPPADNEMGWKDTFIVPPGYVGRVVARFDRVGRYVWHCHILSHEDHEMMRPFYVNPALPKQTPDVIASATDFSLGQNFPNPFNPTTTINFSIAKENTLTSLKIYNSLGEEVGTLLNQVIPAGDHEVQFDASELSSGVYFYVLRSGNFVDSRKMILLK